MEVEDERVGREGQVGMIWSPHSPEQLSIDYRNSRKPEQRVH
jgi:hypothetical protein